jgi:aminoglycoside phosphotransferase (APT) family kinase protein
VSTRFTLRDLAGAEPMVEKRGPADALAREAEGLRLVAGRPWAPRLVAARPGVVVTSRCPGAPRALAALGAGDARRLGAVLREVHETRRAAEGGLWWWASPAGSPDAYRERRAEDAEAALAGTPFAGLARRALPVASGGGGAPEPFRLLHGDLVEANLVWGSGGPALVDWEFWRMGDPAEDLAYLAELNRLPDAVFAEVLGTYGRPEIAGTIDAWRPIVALDAGGWYLGQGMAGEAEPLLERGAALVEG